jgi:PAS domain S-box-containing protein
MVASYFSKTIIRHYLVFFGGLTMAPKADKSEFDPQKLRRQAIERLQGRHGKVVDMHAADVATLVHELEVHQVELEVQNDELRRAQLELAAALERYSDLYHRAPVGYLTLDTDGKVLQANQAAALLCFREREELEGQRLETIATREDRDKLWLLLQSATVTGLPQACEFRIWRPLGAPRWVHAGISCLDRFQEAPSGFRMTLTDITARVQTQEILQEQRAEALKLMEDAVEARTEAERVNAELHESEERFHTLADNIVQLAWMADANGRRFWYNQRWFDYTGMTLEEAQGWGWTKAHHPDHVDRVIKGVQQAWYEGKPWEDTFPLRSKTGKYRWFLSRAVPIRDAEGKIVHWFGTNTDITERERLLAEEQRLREVAEAQNRAKDEFLSMVSHELRTPLSAILGYTQMTRYDPHNASAVSRNCEIIERNARAQSQLIDDLLDTARIISGKLKLDLAQSDLRLLLEEAVDVVRSAAEIKQIDLTAQIDEAPRKLLCDATRLGQVVWNLLQNAIKFTPEGGRVAFRVERAGERVRLIVSDTGCGIEPDYLPAIFDRFSQSDMSLTRRHGGLGLGLALVKQLVEMHGGTIKAASEGKGLGATFTVTLPLNAARVVSHMPPTPAIVESSAEPAAIPLEDLPRLDGLRALVVDDQEEMRAIIAGKLGKRGAAVTVAASGREALELLEGSAFDALVCDIAMPEMDGYELIRRLRAMEKTREQRLPAIALTALARSEDRIEALKAGFQVHIAKPVELNELVIILASIVQFQQRQS